MPGTIRIWWHDGAAQDARNNDIPVVNEPELGFETIDISAEAASTGPAPGSATVALIESDVGLRYRVRRAGESAPAGPLDSKPMAPTGGGVDFIGVRPGFSISFIEA